MTAQPQTQGWYVAQWGFWGWLETAIKLVGIVAGILALINSLPADGFTIANNRHLVAVILLVLYTLVTLVAIGLRIQQHEIISMIYAILNTIGHLSVIVALLRQPTETTLPLVFAVCHVLGELVKQQFLRQSGYTESGRDKAGMLRVSYIFMSAYALLIVALVL